jgi:hypothetical protein
MNVGHCLILCVSLQTGHGSELNTVVKTRGVVEARVFDFLVSGFPCLGFDVELLSARIPADLM